MKKLFLALVVAMGIGAAYADEIKIKISAGGESRVATLADNATSRALIAKMPLELAMEDLYDRELCYRFGAGALPVEKTVSDAYEIGEIAYWPPRGSLVILYAQNGERFERVRLGRIEGELGAFASGRDMKVKFEAIK